jgi:TetR/AcrR family transcriptional regulator
MKRQDTIIKAAFEVFARDGFHGASMRKIAAAAKLKSPSLIYWYFKDKEELVRAVMNQQSPLLRELPNFQKQIDTPPEEMLPRVATIFLSILDTPQLFRVFISNAASMPDMIPHTKNILPALEFLVAYLERQVALGRLRRHSSQSSARAFIGTLLGYALASEILTPFRQGIPERKQYIRDVCAIFLKGLCNEGEPSY